MTQTSRRNDGLKKGGRSRVEDYVDRREKFKNQKIIARRFSVRHPQREIEAEAPKKIPDMLDGRLVLV